MSKTTSDILTRHYYIIKWLQQKPYTVKELQNRLVNKVTERQIRNNIAEISDNYKIEIQKDSKGNYWIDNIPQTSDKYMDMINSYFNVKLFEDNQNSNFIELERTNLVEQYNFEKFIYFCKNRNTITFHYDNFWWDERQYKVEPYLLKQFRNRWYLIGKIIEMSGKKDGLYEQINNQIYNFSLDRFSQEKGIVNTQETFKNPNFDAKEFYKNSFGILKPETHKNKTPEEVILSFEPIQGRYIKKLPLHHSQEIIFEDENKEVRIRLKIYITYDFVQEIFHFGENVKVIAPQSLKDSMQKANAHIKTYYDENDALPSRPTLY